MIKGTVLPSESITFSEEGVKIQKKLCISNSRE